MEPQVPRSVLSSSTLDLEASMVDQQQVQVQVQAQPQSVAVDVPPLNGSSSFAARNAHKISLEWQMVVIGFCFSWAVAIALQSFQTCAPLSLSVSFHLLCLGMVVAVAALIVSKYISPKFPNGAQVLDHVGVLFGVTAFFFAITVPFPLYLKLIYWTIYALSLLAIFLSIRR